MTKQCDCLVIKCPMQGCNARFQQRYGYIVIYVYLYLYGTNKSIYNCPLNLNSKHKSLLYLIFIYNIFTYIMYLLYLIYIYICYIVN